jgi:uncharacterized protein (DUF433 family)
MVASSLEAMLGNGIYTINEAALYSRINSQSLGRWLFGNASGRHVVMPQFGTKERRISFRDFVQVLAIREIRIQRKVPLNKFRQAIDIARNRFGMEYPFAMKHYTALWGEELVIRPSKDEIVQASGKNKGNRLLSFVESYLEDLSFDEETGIANLYKVYQHNKVSIKMQPGIRFGEPMLPSGYTARAIWNSIRVEGGIKHAAKAYGIELEEVEAAYRFFVNHLGRTAA